MSSPPIPPLANAVQRKEKSSEDDTDTSSTPLMMTAPRVVESLETTPILMCGSQEKPEASDAVRWSPSDKTDMAEKIVQVAKEAKGHVIGRKGRRIREIRAESGASILDHAQGFLITGRPDQIACAEKQILHTLERRHKVEDKEFVPVESQYRGYVIGHIGAKIKEIQSTTGTVVKNHEQGFSVIGSPEQINAAKDAILRLVEEARKKDQDVSEKSLDIPESAIPLLFGKGGARFDEVAGKCTITVSGPEGLAARALTDIKRVVNQSKIKRGDFRWMSFGFIDNSNLRENCIVRLIPSRSSQEQEDRYELRATEKQKAPNVEACSPESSTPGYLPDLQKSVLTCLQEIKKHSKAGEDECNDMWGHFGRLLLKVPEEDVVKDWSLLEARAKLNGSPNVSQSNSQPAWRTGKFVTGVGYFDEQSQLGKLLRKPAYSTRYDVSFMTPSTQEVRLKVWIDSKEMGSVQDEILFDDLKNIIETIHFKDEKTNGRCKGRLCFPSVRRLRADIVFPGADFDFRLMIGKREQVLIDIDQAENKDVSTLAEYVSLMTLKEGEEDELPLPDVELPSNFDVQYRRRSERGYYQYSEDFTAIVSKELSYPSSSQTEAEMKMDLHLHCKEWDQLLGSGQWEPEEVVEKLPEFMNFVKTIHQMIAADQK